MQCPIELYVIRSRLPARARAHVPKRSSVFFLRERLIRTVATRINTLCTGRYRSSATVHCLIMKRVNGSKQKPECEKTIRFGTNKVKVGGQSEHIEV
jgi:hypothetical protein